MQWNWLKCKAHRRSGYPSWVLQTCERRAGADAPGELYQKGAAPESPPGPRGPGRRRPSGGGGRVDGRAAVEMRELLAEERQGSLAATRAGLAGPEGSRPGAGAALRAASGSMPTMRATRGRGSLGGSMATDHPIALVGDCTALQDALVEGDGAALRGGLEDGRFGGEEGGGVGVGASGVGTP